MQENGKGAAVAAAAYLSKQYPDAQGFSPRNLRRMRDFYRAYEDHPTLFTLAMQLGWTQNIVILEADLSMDQRKWYLKAASQFGWSARYDEDINSALFDFGQNFKKGADFSAPFSQPFSYFGEDGFFVFLA